MNKNTITKTILFFFFLLLSEHILATNIRSNNKNKRSKNASTNMIQKTQEEMENRSQIRMKEHSHIKNRKTLNNKTGEGFQPWLDVPEK